MQTGVSWMLYVWLIKPIFFLASASVTGRSSTLRAIHSAKLGLSMGFHGDSIG
jgi:hypothetical protein